jgi:hypothetical protein
MNTARKKRASWIVSLVLPLAVLLANVGIVTHANAQLMGNGEFWYSGDGGIPRFTPVVDGDIGDMIAHGYHLSWSPSKIFEWGDTYGYSQDSDLESRRIRVYAIDLDNNLYLADSEDPNENGTDADLTTHYYFSWDEDYFYIAADNNDNHYDVTEDQSGGPNDDAFWQRDTFWITFDLSNGTGPNNGNNIVNLWATPIDAGAAAYSLQIEHFENGSSSSFLRFGNEPDSFLGAQMFGGPTPIGYFLEIRIPWDLIFLSAPDQRDDIGVDFPFRARFIIPDPDGDDSYGQTYFGGDQNNLSENDRWPLFTLQESLQSVFESIELGRVAVFPDEPVDVLAQFSGGMNFVQAKIFRDRADPPIDIIDLFDDGNPPDAKAGDHLFSGQWSGSSQLSAYSLDLLGENLRGNGIEKPDIAGFEIGHTILSVPDKMLVSPEGLENVRIPILIEDLGSGYLTSLNFLSDQFDIHLDGNGLEPINPSLSFIGTVQEGLGGILDDSAIWDPDAEDWRLHSARADATPLDLFAATEPQEIFAFIDLEIDPIDPGELNVDIEHIMFDEEGGAGIAKACCGNLQMGRGDVDDSRIIDSFDAALVLMHTVRKVDLDAPDDAINDQVETDNGFTFPAAAGRMAEVSDKMGITPFDASLILRRAVGLIDYFPSEEGSYRLWDPPTGWWKPPAEPPPTKPVATARPMSRTIAVGPMEKREDGLITVAIVIDAMEDVLAGSFALRFDPDHLRPVGVESTDLTENYLFADHAQGDIARVGFAGAESQSGSGALASVLFQPLDATGTIDALELVEAQLNESAIDVRIAASTLSTASAVPRAFALYPNFPNPFNPSTTIRYDLSAEGRVRLGVYDLIGQRIRQLLDDHQPAGRHQLEWNGADQTGGIVASGVYLLRLETDRGILVRKMSMIK